MSENKFIRHLKGEGTAKSLLEVKNQSTPTTFANMPNGTSDANTVYSDHRGNATGVLKGAENWKINGSALVESPTVYGDGRDFIDSYRASGNSVWVDATFTLASAKRFLANTKFVLKLCGSKLDSVIEDTIGFTLIVNLGNNTTITKTFQVTEQAFDFCKEFVIDFAESNASAIKLDAADTIKVQLVCADATASATIYNGMSVFTALQRRVDSETVSSDTLSLDEIETDLTTHIANKNNPHEVTKAQVGLGNCDNTSDLDKPISTATQDALNTKVNIDGTSIMTGPLKMRATSSFQCAIAPYWDGVGFFKLNSDNSVTLIASIDTTDGFLPWTTNTYNIGSSLKKWKNLYLSEKMYVATINNGGDLAVPANVTGTLATKADVDLAANSGRMITDEGVWYAKMDAAGTIPSYAEFEGRNYADFTQTNQDGDPIIVIYTYTSGVWTETETITPPAQYDGYVPVTSKIWDIAEQTGQQGGRILWNHQTKTFTPYPLIISTDNMNITNSSFQGEATLSGVSTVVMPATPTPQQIVNKDYVDSVADPLKYATNCITEIPQDIKLELSSGTLTLKAGSKVYVPNGVDTFDVITIASDLTIDGGSGGFSGSGTLYYNYTNSVLAWYASSTDASGTTPPSTSNFYNTSTNTIYRYRNSVQGAQLSFPLAHIVIASDVITGINQVFNGFGYIGSTVFCLPGVKLLAPYGRNVDGTLKNYSWTTPSVIIRTQTSNGTQSIAINTIQGIFGIGDYIYNEQENLIYSSGSVSDRRCVIGNMTISGGIITSFTTKTVFHAVDYNDTEYIAHQAMPSGTHQSITVGASGTEYTASKDGVYYFKMENTTLSNHWVNVHIDGTYVANYWAMVANNSFGLPPFFVRKGGKIKISYGSGISGGNCYFVPTVGAN